MVPDFRRDFSRSRRSTISAAGTDAWGGRYPNVDSILIPLWIPTSPGQSASGRGFSFADDISHQRCQLLESLALLIDVGMPVIDASHSTNQMP
jgi:hypothetical protein